MSEPNQMTITPDERRAVGLYAVLARDVGDFIEMLGEASDATLSCLRGMLALENPKHDRPTRELNEIGLSLVMRQIEGRT